MTLNGRLGWFALLFSSAAIAEPLAVPVGTEVLVETAEPLSSKTHVKGDLIKLRTAADVVIGSTTVIRSGTSATGQIVEARAKGAMGMNGKLTIRPLYLQVGDVTIRLIGSQREKASVTPGAVIGMVILTTPAFTGRSANIPVGTRISAMVERAVEVRK